MAGPHRNAVAGAVALLGVTLFLLVGRSCSVTGITDAAGRSTVPPTPTSGVTVELRMLPADPLPCTAVWSVGTPVTRALERCGVDGGPPLAAPVVCRGGGLLLTYDAHLYARVPGDAAVRAVPDGVAPRDDPAYRADLARCLG